MEELSAVLSSQVGKPRKLLESLRALESKRADVGDLSLACRAPPSDLLRPILAVLEKMRHGNEERKVVRHLYGLMSRILTCDPVIPREDLSAVMNALCGREFAQEDVARRTIALRTIGVILARQSGVEPGDRQRLVGMVQRTMSVVMGHLPTRAEAGSKKKKKERKTRSEACHLCSGLFFALSFSLPESREVGLRYCYPGMICTNVDTARQGFRLALALAECRGETRISLGEMLKTSFFSGPNLKAAISSDACTALLWLQICRLFVGKGNAEEETTQEEEVMDFFSSPSREPSKGKEGADAPGDELVPHAMSLAFQNALVMLLHDDRLHVRMETIITMAECLGWSKLCEREELLPAIVKKITEAAQQHREAIVLRAMESVARSCVRDGAERGGVGRGGGGCDTSGVSLLSGSLQLVDPLSRLSCLLPPLRARLESCTLPGETLSCLNVLIWLTQPPERVGDTVPDLMLRLKSSLSRLSTDHSARVMQTLTSRVRLTPSMAPTLLQIIVHQFRTNPGVAEVDVMLETWAACLLYGSGVGESVLRSVFHVLSVASTELTEGNAQSAAWIRGACWFLGENAAALRAMPQWVETVVHRLLQHAALGSWQVRRACVRSLTQIALELGEPWKVSIYSEFVDLLRQREDVGAASLASELGLVPLLRAGVEMLDLTYDNGISTDKREAARRMFA